MEVRGMGTGVGGANYSPESITTDENEEIIYLSISTKLFMLSLCLCVYPCALGPLIAAGGGDKPARENCVGKLNKLFTSFISHACSSLVNTVKSICHPLSRSSRSDLHFVSHLYFCLRHCQWGRLHLGNTNKNIMEIGSRPKKA